VREQTVTARAALCPAPAPTAATAPPIVHQVLRGSGRPLDTGTRAVMEPRFGHSFADVRVHDDAGAADSARAVGARAYAVGRDLVFGRGEYRPGTAGGDRLLAHELAHAVQQHGAGDGAPHRSLEVGRSADPAERQADAAAEAVAAGRRVPTATPEGTVLRRSDFERGMGATLPYREATELAECVRIMGDESREYCQEQVLHGDLGGRAPAAPGRSTPLADMSTYQSPGASGWWGARYGCYRNQCSRRHRGWDVHAATGTAIRAVESGALTRHRDPGGYGDYVRLRSSVNSDLNYLYAHLSAREPVGDYGPGDVIGSTGVSGNASADRPHLHFQVLRNGTAEDPAAHFTEPTQVIEATGSAAAAIDRTLPEPCAPCGM
jgi:murein DD-endopeptidase MepM/ murein hydrolase activator NlpD